MKGLNTCCHPKIEPNEDRRQIYFDIEPSTTGRNATVTLTAESLLDGFLTRTRNMIKIVQKGGENLRFDNLVITSLYKRISNSIQGAFLICYI